MSTKAKAASPWDALLRVPPQRLNSEPRTAATEAKAGTKLATVLDALAERGTATTLTLAVCADLTPKQVWGLLKQPRQIGQVRFSVDRWELVEGFAGREVERAAALLRDLGWRVEPPPR